MIDKQQLLQNLNSINDQEMLKEIEDAIKAQKELLKEIVKREMEHTVELSVPLIVDISEGKNWAEAH